MAAVYFVFAHNVTNPEQLKEYGAEAGGTLEPTALVAADTSVTTIEGDDRRRVVILKFESEEAAMEWYNSDAYQKALPLRLNSISDGWAGIVKAAG
jgi:uncharacterized protein (DUF1330 family)